MINLIRKTQLYRAIQSNGEKLFSQAVLAIFPDEKYLRLLLKECAKGFFKAEEGSRIAGLIDKELFSDLLIFPDEEKKFTVDLSVNVLEESLLRPVESREKLIILTDFHTAPALVQNKLLKLLEEPPEGVRFLLGAVTEQPVLPTVLSRVKKIVVPPFTEEEIFGALSRKYPEGNLRAAAAAGGGVFSVAESLLSGEESFRFAEEFLSSLRVETCEKIGKIKTQTEFFAALRAILRDMLFYKSGHKQYVLGASRKVAELAEQYPFGVIVYALEQVTLAEGQIKFNANFASCIYALALGIKEEIGKWKRLS